MDKQSAPFLEAVETVASRLKSEAKSEVVRAKLGHLDEACSHVVVKAGQRPTIPLVCKVYAGLVVDPKLAMAGQSIRNGRGGANPYRQLYQAWAAAAEGILKAGRRKGRTREVPHDEILSQDDLDGIADINLRGLVRLVVAQNRALRTEREMLRRAYGTLTVNAGPRLDHEPGRGECRDAMAMNEAEVDAIRDFLDPKRMKARGLRRAADGAIETVDGRPLSDPAFATALEKMTRSA
jgi:hypothetical protein